MKISMNRSAAVLVILPVIFSIVFPAQAIARDPVADEFDAIASLISSPPSTSWMQHAYSAESIPLGGEDDPIKVLLRRTRTLLNEFNTDGTLNSLDASLDALEAQNAPGLSGTERLSLFREVEAVSRKVAFANPLLNFKDIVFLKREFSGYSHMVDQYFGHKANPGGGIYILENAFSDNPTLRDVLAGSVLANGRFQGQPLSSSNGCFSNPSLSYDGKTIYFAYTRTDGPYDWTEDSCYHLFRVNVDGTDLRQLTDGPYNDLHPYPLPNGRIVFISERRGGYGRCHERPCKTYSLYTANADGTDITMLSAHETNEWHPSVDNDGMIVYTRWDYVDRGADMAHHPWITYPDGRDARALQGNWKPYASASPYMEQHVRAIPGSHKYVATASPHHGQTFGSFVLIDPRVEDDGMMSPLKVLTPEAQFPEATTGSGSHWKFATARALNERFYLCGYDPYGNGTGSTHALTLIDAKTGLKTNIYHDPDIPCYHPTPLMAQPVPPLIPHRVASGRPLAPGEVFDPSVYDNMPTTGKVVLMNVYDSRLPLPAGTTITHLRIMEVLPKTTWDHLVPHIGYAHEDPARRVLGTVPVESDGSAYFTVPADTPFFFQALDANGMAVQSMRSLTYAKPGDTLTCAGCHEKQGSAPRMDVPAQALKRDPSDITPEGVPGANPFSYPLLVQPVLDAKCISCHGQGDSIDLRAGNYSSHEWYWYTSYLNLESYAFYYGPYANSGYDTWHTPEISTPGQVGAMASPLYQNILSQNHYGVQLTTEEMRRLTLWLDSNSDFFGAYENTLSQAQGNVVQPIDPQATDWQTVANTTYGPAIPAEPPLNLGNNNGLSEFGSPLELAAPLLGGEANRPVTLGQAGAEIPFVEAGPDSFAYDDGTIVLNGTATIGGQPVDTGTVVVAWSQITGPTDAVFGDPGALSTSVQFPQPGSYLLRLAVNTDVTTGNDEVLVTVLLINSAPLVDAGSDRTATGSGSSLPMAGFVYDDSSSVTANWTQTSGPGTAVFDDPAASDCTVTFPNTGTYVLRLTADDGETQSFDECTVDVAAQSGNAPPTVSSGDDVTTSYSNNPLILQGSASDDGIPGPLTTTWSKISGPGTVTFGDPSSPTTTADFSTYGYYLLQLTADDGERTAYDQLAVYFTHPTGLDPGSITWEYWDNIGSTIADLTNDPRYPNNPDLQSTLTAFQGPSNYDDAYGTRIHGYLLPQTSGDYTFWIASDDDSELWLSTDSNPANEVQIASVTGWTGAQEWNKFSSQQSSPISLVAGSAYYIKALQRDGNGGDNLAVAWQGPGIAQAVIDGQYLSDGSGGGWQPPPSGGMVVPGENQTPGVSAGPDLEIALDGEAVLRGVAVDDGLPESSVINAQWQKAGGPGNVTFSDASSLITTATFSAVGRYLLRFEANDGDLSNSDTVLITVSAPTEYDYFYPSPQEVAWSADGSLLAVADAGLNRVAIIDAATQSVLSTIPVEGSPRGMAWISASEFWVCEYDAGTLALVDVSTGRVVRRIKVGPKPYDIKFDSTRQQLVVTEYGLSKIWIIDVSTGATVATVPAIAKPMYLALAPDASKALVANSSPQGDARDAAHAAAVTVVDLNTHVESQIALPYGSTSLRGIVVSPDGNWAYVAHLLGRPHLPTTQLNDGWVFNNVISILNLNNDEVYATVLLDALEEGAANPWGLALADGGNQLWVCGSGVHELISLDLTEVHGYLAADPQTLDNIDYDMITLYENGWIERHPLPGKGPRGVALAPDGSMLAVASYFGGEVQLFDPTSRQVVAEVASGPVVPEHALRRGERLYFDGDGCFQRWLSCSSCHPGARSDGLNWDLLNDGIGNPKNSMSHLYSTATPPSMSTGVRPDVAAAIAAGFKFIQFQQRSEQEMQDSYDYLASIRPEQSPYLNKKWMTDAAIRGKAIFNSPSVGCANCHSGPYFTDGLIYDVGTGHPDDVGPYDPLYVTPILDELWNSAPFLHDGSAPTLRDVLTTQNTGNQHGNTLSLTSTEIDDLVAYLEQIPGIDDWINQAPVVDAGADKQIASPINSVQMAATASDEGLPSSTLAGHWELVSGPDNVVFSDSTDPATDVTFTAPGDYVFEFIADDGDITNMDTVRVTVFTNYAGDLTFDGKVNLLDMAELGQGWQTLYNMDTLLNVANDWLQGCY